jgi:dihydroflavonol-4-reductase
MILVTGATGLVGSHLLIALLEDYQSVRAIYRNTASIEKTRSLFQLYDKEHLFKSIQWIQADITDVTTLADTFENIEFVYHCAALISFDPKEEEELRKTNIEGTANVVNFCIDFGIQKLCYVSSIAALGDLKEHETIITESTEWNPEFSHSDYAISKYGAEMEVFRGQQEGLNVVILNPGVIIGPGFWDSGSGLLYTKIKKGMLFYTKGSSGFVGVNDVVKSMIQGMKSTTNGERFTVVAENCNYETVLKTIAISMNVKAPKLFANRWLTEVFWRIDWLISIVFRKKRILSKNMSESLHQKHSYSNEKIKSIYSITFQDLPQYIMEIGKLYPQK